LLGSRVVGGEGLDQRDPGLFGGGGVVANPARNDKELARMEQDIAAIGRGAANAELTAKDEKHLVFRGVRMPGKLSLNTRYFDELIVDLADHARRPQRGNSATGEFKGDGMLLHRQVFSSTRN
jgi:hypothetical protein